MSRYLFCGQIVTSDIAIPELAQVDHVIENEGIAFSISNARLQSADVIWARYWLSPDGKKTIYYATNSQFHWLRFPGLADFCISKNVDEIICHPLPEIPEETICHLLLDQVLPRSLAHQGKLILHASAIQIEHGLILFLGSSGVGKSTLAGDFHQTGNLVVSDDCVWVKKSEETIKAVPSYAGLRLWEDSLQVLFPTEQYIQPMVHYSTKKRISLDKTVAYRFRKGGQVLAVIMLSSPRQSSDLGIEFNRLPLRAAFIEIANETFQLDSYDFKERGHHMQILGDVVTRIPTYRLSMPHDYALLPLVRQRILETVL